MKKSLFTIVLAAMSSMVFSQSIEISPTYGYTLSGTVDSYYGYFDVRNVDAFGLALNVEVSPGTHVELSYRRSEPDVRSRGIIGFDGLNFEMGIEHYHIGVLQEFADDQIKPFAELTMGMSRYFETHAFSDEIFRFSTNVGMGVKLFFNDAIGIRLQTNLMMPMELDGVGIFCGFGTGGSGCSGGVGIGIPIVHWELAGGLIFRISQ